MRNGDKSMRERGLEWNRGKEVFLWVAAYRATHAGKNPPLNSELWKENIRVWKQNHPRFSLARLLGLNTPESAYWKTEPLKRFLVDRIFLIDDHSWDEVENRLDAWPMVSGYGPPKRHTTGEWFQYEIEVLADDLDQARQIIDYIFSLDQEY
jgi:hypothetical protein